MRLPNWLLSSTGEGVAKRWKAFFAGVVPVVTLLAPLFGIELPPLQDLEEAVGKIILAIWSAVSAVAFIQGWMRKIEFKEKKLGKYAS